MDPGSRWSLGGQQRGRLARHCHLRCRGPDHQEIEATLQDQCKVARKDLQRAIAQAKAQA